jgi:Rrf2 family iron-sulfur cluster assembly transcriptional regulator
MLPIKFYETLETVLYVALYSAGRAVSSSEICHYKKISPRSLEQLMQLLVRHHILKGMTGPKGGYTLAREKRKMTLAEIFQLFYTTFPVYEPANPIGHFIKNNIQNKLDHALLEILHTITLEDLSKQMARAPKMGPDFNI